MESGKRNATMDEIIAARAHNESRRERLAARRQKRTHLIAEASQTKTTSKTVAAVAALLASKSCPTTDVTKVKAAEISINTDNSAVSPVCQPMIVPKVQKVCTAGVLCTSTVSKTTNAPMITAFKMENASGNRIIGSPDKPVTVSQKAKIAHTTEISIIPSEPEFQRDVLSETSNISTIDPVTEVNEEVPKRIVCDDEDTFATPPKQAKVETTLVSTLKENDLERLLSAETAKEREIKRVNDEIMDLLKTPSTMEKVLNEKFRSQGGSQVQLFCLHGTRIDCTNASGKNTCKKLHFRKIIHTHTDESLGDCSFLNTCFHVETCKYVHYEIDPADLTTAEAVEAAGAYNRGQLKLESVGNSKQASAPLLKTPAIDGKGDDVPLYPPQWINCDIRQLDMSVLGKFSVIMADPPWDIHMELPYGTMSDDEMRRMDIPILQDDGYIFLWVTGRAMELGRECLKLWGYERVDELIWVKTNQLQRLIRTGRTGHWLNHGKEHCLVGMKGNPKCMNKGLDCDVIVSEVRETSRKPDEVYGIIERLSPGTRKIELFGRPHNVQANWLTLGNQLDGTYLVDPAVVERYRKRYPNGTDSKTAK